MLFNFPEYNQMINKTKSILRKNWTLFASFWYLRCPILTRGWLVLRKQKNFEPSDVQRDGMTRCAIRLFEVQT